MNKSNPEYYHALAFAEKNNYLRFIYNLGEKGLKKIFKFPREHFSLWWFSLIAEKSPFKSDAYGRLISFLASGNNKYQEKVIKLRFKRLLFYQFLVGLYEFCLLFLRMVYIKLSMKNSKKIKNQLSNLEYLIVSYFPLINKELAKKDIFKNEFLGLFHQDLEEKLSFRYAHILVQVKINGHDLKDSIRLAKRFLNFQSLFFLEEFFRIKHLFLLIFYYLYFSIIFVMNLGWIKKNTVYEYKQNKYNVWEIFKKDFYNSFCGFNLIYSLWYILLFKELIRKLDHNTKVICICEMQCWEKALYIYAKKQGLATIGVQHTITPELLLNYFNVHEEIGDGDFMKHCPLPGYLATVGSIPAETFKKYGWSEKRVFIWGAQRFVPLSDMMKSQYPWEDKDNYFVCAFSINSLEAKKIILLFKDVFKEYCGYKIFLKAHPTLELQKIINEVGLKLNPEIFQPTELSLPDIIQRAKGIITTDSSSSFYALACRIPVIVVRFPDKIDCNPLSYISDIPIYVYSAEQLRSTCDKIISSSSPLISYEKCNDFLEKYLYFPDDNREFFEKIASLK